MPWNFVCSPWGFIKFLQNNNQGSQKNFHGIKYIVIYEALCFNVAQGRMNGAPNETRTHSCRFASQAC